MATNYIVTGHTGEAHITSDDVRTFNAYTLGTSDYILPSNDEFTATVVDNHTVSLASGDLLMQGIHARIPYGTAETLEFEIGTAGYLRTDLIIARYENDGTIESVEFSILQGDSATSNPVTPTPTSGDLLHGDELHEMPLYAVHFDGTVITSVEALYDVYRPSSGAILTCTLTSDGWSDNTQTVNVAGLPSSGFAYTISPSGGYYTQYTSAGIYADDVTTDNYITFNCTTVPSANIVVSVLKVQVG